MLGPPAADAPSSRSTGRVADLLLVGALAVAAFAGTLRNGFVWDDVVFLPANPKLAAITDPRVIFGARFWDFASVPGSGPVYRPVATTLLWAMNGAFGTSAVPYHAVSVLLHVACVILVYLLARRLAPGSPRAAPLAAAALFAAHPVHTEAVAWIISSMHPLATAFALLAAHAQLSHSRGGGARWLLASAAASTAAMLSSEGAFAVPFVLLGLEWLVTRRAPRATAALALAAAFALAFLLRMRAVGSEVPFTLTREGLWTAFGFAAGYVRQLVWPWPQAIHMVLPPGGLATPANVIVAGSAAVGAIALAARLDPQERPRPLFALFWIAVTLGPLLLAPLNRPLFAPRALYLPSVGLSLLVAWAVERIHHRAPRAVVASVGALVALGVVGCNVASAAWIDNVSVHRRVLQSAPLASGIHLRLGQILEERGERDDARRSFDDAVRLATAPQEQVEAMEALAVFLGSGGETEEAERILRELAVRAPTRPGVSIGLGNLAFGRGDLANARAWYERAIAVAPDSWEAASNLALVLEAAGDVPGAEAARARAAALRR